ncbi:MAG: hypothetical protein IPP13_22195 [Kouleothrix sp.]|nr:hypothetical protein [Kouleothrix sp.]
MTMALSATYKPFLVLPASGMRKINWKWLLQRVPMVALALLSSWGVGGFILQSGKANSAVAIVGAGAFDLVFLGVIALADQQLTVKRSTHVLYWALNVGAAAVAALMNTLYYSGGTYASITAESITHGALFAVFGLLYSLYYHGVMSEALQADETEAQRLRDIVECRYCGAECKNQAAEYSHFRTCSKHPKNAKA